MVQITISEPFVSQQKLKSAMPLEEESCAGSAELWPFHPLYLALCSCTLA